MPRRHFNAEYLSVPLMFVYRIFIINLSCADIFALGDFPTTVLLGMFVVPMVTVGSIVRSAVGS